MEPIAENGRGERGMALAPPTGVARASSAPSPGTAPARHCWVTGSVTGADRPGLLVEWRQAPHGWQGRVFYPALLSQVDRAADLTAASGDWVVVEEWLPAAQLRPL